MFVGCGINISDANKIHYFFMKLKYLILLTILTIMGFVLIINDTYENTEFINHEITGSKIDLEGVIIKSLIVDSDDEINFSEELHNGWIILNVLSVACMTCLDLLHEWDDFLNYINGLGLNTTLIHVVPNSKKEYSRIIIDKYLNNKLPKASIYYDVNDEILRRNRFIHPPTSFLIFKDEIKLSGNPLSNETIKQLYIHSLEILP